MSRSRDARALPPVELDDARLGDAPVGEVGADPQRHDEGGVPAALADEIVEGDDRATVEVIVVVVRDHHRVERRQLGERERRRVPGARADAGDRRRAVAPERIGEHAVAVELDQHRRVSEPGHAQPGRRRRLEARRVARHHRNRRQRAARRAGAKDAGQALPVVIDQRLRVDEVVLPPLRRPRHPHPPLAGGPLAKRRPPQSHHSRERQHDHRPEDLQEPAHPATHTAQSLRDSPRVIAVDLRPASTTFSPAVVNAVPVEDVREVGPRRNLPAPPRIRPPLRSSGEGWGEGKPCERNMRA